MKFPWVTLLEQVKLCRMFPINFAMSDDIWKYRLQSNVTKAHQKSYQLLWKFIKNKGVTKDWQNIKFFNLDVGCG